MNNLFKNIDINKTSTGVNQCGYRVMVTLIVIHTRATNKFCWFNNSKYQIFTL